MSEKKQQEKIERIRKRILKSGYPLEIEIGNVLRKSGWLVANQFPYLDKESSKIRLVDLLASKSSFLSPLSVLLLLECKKSLKYEWVFHTQERGKEFLPFLMVVVEVVKTIKRIRVSQSLRDTLAKGAIPAEFNSLHILEKDVRIGVFNVTPSPKSKDDFYEATMQITSALGGLEQYQKGGHSVVFPTIVFDGEMFEFYQEKNKTEILPINHLQFVTYSKSSSGMSPCLIDVVRKAYFPKFLQKIEQDFSILVKLATFKGV